MPVIQYPENVQTFSTTIGLLYIFNLIVGTGALTLPKAFQSAGYILGLILLLISEFTSYISATFVIETLAIANYILNKPLTNQNILNEEQILIEGENNDENNISEEEAEEINKKLILNKRIELAEMSHIFLGIGGTIFTYIILIIYLFGDLAVYSTMVPKSLMNIICSTLNSSSLNSSLPCHNNPNDWLHLFSRFFVYQFCILIFVIFCFPMILMGMTKTKWLQLSTTLSRWTAFILMIVMAINLLLNNGVKGHPPPINFNSFGSLFGVTVYAFMCHHSIPGLIFPIREIKNNFNIQLFGVYTLIYLFYCALSLTGSFAFEHTQDIYTINFLHEKTDNFNFFNLLIDYFLALFPVFVLTSSYIIVAITLCNNIRVLVKLLINKRINSSLENQNIINNDNQPLLQNEYNNIPPSEIEEEQTINYFNLFNNNIFNYLQTNINLNNLNKYLIPIIILLIPSLISMTTDNVLLLASITGSFPGVGVQYILPAILILNARRALFIKIGSSTIPSNLLSSPFKHWLWPIAILCWAIFAIIIVSTNIFHLG
ncbi:hypothetical protein Mgra_00009174 [Meloidogyne graminicola]|uniref:Amino acid transporter transmembrane domain-containing protein n=1 Tax=Meloidogyne graminicola TaxID=189291 RepID=A0A8S9ZDK9_9BILA|nr:hypothetical protein Mgra_00009174 [Meloidogyne graminicola]